MARTGLIQMWMVEIIRLLKKYARDCLVIILFVVLTARLENYFKKDWFYSKKFSFYNYFSLVLIAKISFEFKGILKGFFGFKVQSKAAE